MRNTPLLTMSGKCSADLLLLNIALTMLVVCIESRPNQPLLRGVTIRNWPYADRVNDRYEGFVVDLMNKIGEHAGFDYRLFFSPDGKYGTEYNGHMNGMIGEVDRNRADFAIADLTVTDSRQRYIDFTEPFMENQLSAIIRKEDAVGLATLEDLVRQNEVPYDSPRASPIAYGTYRTGSTFFYLSRSRDSVARQMYSWMSRHPEALVTSAKEGFDRVNAGRYAFIVESTFAEYLTGIYCNLTILYDTRQLYPRQFAIALPKASPYMKAFNDAIRELKANGVIERLKAKYWTNRCFNANPSVDGSEPGEETGSKVTATSSPRPISMGKLPVDDEHRRTIPVGSMNVPKRYHDTPLESRSQAPSYVPRPTETINSEWEHSQQARGHHPRVMPAYHPHNPNGYQYNRRKYPHQQPSQPNSISESSFYSSASSMSAFNSAFVAVLVTLLVGL